MSATVRPQSGKLQLSEKSPTVRLTSTESRIANAVSVFRKEHAALGSERLSEFMLCYYCVDVVTHLIQGRWNGLGPADSFRQKKNRVLRLPVLLSALRSVPSSWDEAQLKEVLNTETKHSARNLRNSIAHQLDKDAISTVRSHRGSRLLKHMNRFIDRAESFVLTGNQFNAKR